MRRLLLLVLTICFTSALALAQFGGREGDVVLYMITAKGPDVVNVVSPTTTNTGAGFTTIESLKQPLQPFGPDYPGESFVLLHKEDGDSFRMIQQLEGILTPRSEVVGNGKLFIAEGMDRLIIPGKNPIDLTAGLYAPFPKGDDFGPEVPLITAHSFMWTDGPIFPLFQRRSDDFISPLNPPGLTGNEYILQLGNFAGILRWVGLNKTQPGAGWQAGIDFRTIEQDHALGATVRMMRLRQGKKTPTFTVAANTHLVVLSGRVQITPAGGSPVTLNKFDYAFVPPNFAITLANPAQFDFTTGDGAEAPAVERRQEQ